MPLVDRKPHPSPFFILDKLRLLNEVHTRKKSRECKLGSRQQQGRKEARMFACGQSWQEVAGGGQVDGMFGQLQSEAGVGHCRWRVNGANCSERETLPHFTRNGGEEVPREVLGFLHCGHYSEILWCPPSGRVSFI